MLKINNLTKEYEKGEKVLKNINIIFREKEFVSIIGASGSGKSTFLNVISGLDNEYQGEIYYNNKNITRKRKNYYNKFHNQIIGFVFQDYNLIDNYTVYKNIEIVLTIGKQKHKKTKIIKALTQVGLIDKKNKKVKTLSGGEKQRIAIARALINNPSILILDEPTGALDSKTSIEIMNLIKKVSQEKLVIMVTHNENIANKYSNRIITIKDGEFIKDTNPCIKEKAKETKKLHKVGISFINSFLLSLKNLKLKPLRNILTILGFIISLIGLSFIFSISSGFNNQIDNLKKNTLANYPLIINSKENKIKKEKIKIYSYSPYNENNINKELINYVSKISKEDITGITYNYDYKLNIISKNNNSYYYTNSLPLIAIPNNNDYLEKNYKLVKGKLPTNETEVLIKIDDENNINEEILKILSIDKKELYPEELINKNIKIVLNNDLYIKKDDTYQQNQIDEKIYNSKNNITLTVTGIIKSKDNLDFNTIVNESGGAIYYYNSLIESVINKNKKSNIVIDQQNSMYNVFNNKKLTKKSKIELLTNLGDINNPYIIYIYPKTYESKQKIDKYMQKYDYKKNNLSYTDLSKEVIDNFKNIIFSITTVLLIFSIISLIVTLVLITIITYTSILERTKEIGILKVIGARNKDIRGIIIKEVTIISLISSTISIFITKLSINPINKYLQSITELNNLMYFESSKIIAIFLISILISIIGSIVPTLKINHTNLIKSLK